MKMIIELQDYILQAGISKYLHDYAPFYLKDRNDVYVKINVLDSIQHRTQIHEYGLVEGHTNEDFDW